RADLGVMISASHNPYDDNGIKLFGPDGYKLSDELELKIEALIDGNLGGRLAKSGDLGRAKRIDGVQDRYIEFAKRTLPKNLSLEGLRVVIDCANGAGYRVAPEALRELDAEVIAIGIEPNGFNINHECGSTEPAALCQKVKEMRADVGIALDGDADRVLIADERGRVVDGDQLLAVIAESWKSDGRLARPGIVGTVMSNLGFERYLASLELELIRTPVGDRFDPLPQVLKNVRYKSGKPLENATVRSAIKDAEARLDGHGRLLVRPSGTEPVIRVMGEGDDKVLVEEVVDGVVEALTRAA